MLKWLKNAWPWKSKSMTTEQLVQSWMQYANENDEALTKTKPALKKATTRSKTMPLVKSAKPAAFKENIKTEVKAGKPVKQAVAISYAVKKEATKAKSKKK